MENLDNLYVYYNNIHIKQLSEAIFIVIAHALVAVDAILWNLNEKWKELNVMNIAYYLLKLHEMHANSGAIKSYTIEYPLEGEFELIFVFLLIEKYNSNQINEHEWYLCNICCQLVSFYRLSLCAKTL